MKNIKLISIVLIIILSAFLGCVKPPAGTPTPTPTATPTVTETIQPTVVPTTPSPTPTPTPAHVSVPVVYKADVDSYRGFTRIVSNSSKPVQYDVYNRTLTIVAGDTVVWINDADPEEKLTILSEEGLWPTNETKAILRWNFAKFNYTFTQPGTYGVYIKEYPRIQHLKIIVNP
ncbi:Uncharacterised protein [uncultured archaeon]|nr:Uncharacterised protein [uncultured archaeon]